MVQSIIIQSRLTQFRACAVSAIGKLSTAIISDRYTGPCVSDPICQRSPVDVMVIVLVLIPIKATNSIVALPVSRQMYWRRAVSTRVEVLLWCMPVHFHSLPAGPPVVDHICHRDVDVMTIALVLTAILVASSIDIAVRHVSLCWCLIMRAHIHVQNSA